MGKKEGAKCVTGGSRVGNKGYFIEPTLFDDVQDDMAIAKDEIFGPVLAVFKFKDVDEIVDRTSAMGTFQPNSAQYERRLVLSLTDIGLRDDFRQ